MYDRDSGHGNPNNGNGYVNFIREKLMAPHLLSGKFSFEL